MLTRAFCLQDQPRWATAEPYRNYIGWLQKQDLAQAERFWRETLKGFTGPTRLPQDKGPRSAVDLLKTYTMHKYWTCPREAD